MQAIIEKYEEILKKPVPEPFKGYIEELLITLKGAETAVQIQRTKKQSKKNSWDETEHEQSRDGEG